MTGSSGSGNAFRRANAQMTGDDANWLQEGERVVKELLKNDTVCRLFPNLFLSSLTLHPSLLRLLLLVSTSRL